MPWRQSKNDKGMEFKKKYSKEELEELCAWFASRMDKLPADMHLDKAIYVKDFPTTVRHYLEIVRLHGDNPTYSGQVYHLFLMRDNLLAAGME